MHKNILEFGVNIAMKDGLLNTPVKHRWLNLFVLNVEIVGKMEFMERHNGLENVGVQRVWF